MTRIPERCRRNPAACLIVLMFAAPLAFAQGRGVPVVVTTVRELPIQQQLQLSGTVTAERSARLSLATSGLVVTLAVDAGDRVAAGDVLLELDAELARLQWESAEAAAEQARRALDDARRRLEEARSLAPQQSIAETVVRDLAAEVAQDEAALQAAMAQAGYQQGVLHRHQLRAPFGGVISARHTELGEWVTPGEPVLELVAIDRLRIDLQVPEDHLGSVGEGDRVQFTLGANRQQPYVGRIAAVVPVTDPTARTFLLRVVPEKTVANMRPGMSVRADLSLDTSRTGLAVPRDAILRLADGRIVVWVVAQNDGHPVAAERFVRTGLSFEGLVEVSGDLAAGDEVVVRGNESLRNGQTLSVDRLAER